MAEPWQATLAGLLMDGTPDAYGVEWGIEAVDGWDSPDVRFSDNGRPGTHGSWGASALFGGRPLTIKGWADCPSMAAAFDVRDRLPLLTDGTLVRHESVPKQIDVERAGVIRCTEPLDRPGMVTVMWSIPVIARYPFKRATTPATVAVPAGATVPHVATGTAAAEIQVTTTTAGTVVLSSEGLTLRTSDLPAGTVLTSGPGFTNPERTVVGPGGENLFSATLAPMQWPAIVPGANSLVNSGTASLEVTYYPTYA